MTICTNFDFLFSSEIKNLIEKKIWLKQKFDWNKNLIEKKFDWKKNDWKKKCIFLKKNVDWK